MRVPAEFRATCGRYIKEVFSMPGSITDQEISGAAAREQARGLCCGVWVWLLAGAEPGRRRGCWQEQSPAWRVAQGCPTYTVICPRLSRSAMPGLTMPRPLHLLRRACPVQWVADQEFIHRDGRVWDALPQARTPTLVMNGDRDVLVSAAPAALLRLLLRI